MWCVLRRVEGKRLGNVIGFRGGEKLPAGTRSCEKNKSREGTSSLACVFVKEFI